MHVSMSFACKKYWRDIEMKFSIITICYNEEKRLQKTLESVYRQTYSDYEHIIQDGGSLDRTLEIVSRASVFYPKNHLKMYSEKDGGIYDAMNRALSRACGDYICFINSGDFFMDQHTLQDVADRIEATPGMDWYYGSSIVIFPNGDEYLQIAGSIENPQGKDISGQLKRERLGLIHQSIFADKDCFRQNLFDATYRLRAELKWYYKCLLMKKKVKRLDFPVCRYTLGGLSERADSVALNARETRKIFEELHLLTAENRSMLPEEKDYSACYTGIYNQWLALRQAGLSVSDYLRRKGVKKIAVYGYAEFGTHLLNELKNSDIKVSCIIDRQDKFAFAGIEVIKPSEYRGNADLVIVTSVLHFKEIRDEFAKGCDCPVVSIEDILEDMWNPGMEDGGGDYEETTVYLSDL